MTLTSEQMSAGQRAPSAKKMRRMQEQDYGRITVISVINYFWYGLKVTVFIEFLGNAHSMTMPPTVSGSINMHQVFLIIFELMLSHKEFELSVAAATGQSYESIAKSIGHSAAIEYAQRPAAA